MKYRKNGVRALNNAAVTIKLSFNQIWDPYIEFTIKTNLSDRVENVVNFAIIFTVLCM